MTDPFDLSASEAGLKERVNITLCSDDTAPDQAQFIQALTPYLKVSRIEFASHCPPTPTDILCVAFSVHGEVVHLTLNGVIDGERIQHHHRQLPWLTDTKHPLRSTLFQGKQVAFALLLETLLLDLEQIRLRFKKTELRPLGISIPPENHDVDVPPKVSPKSDPRPESKTDRDRTTSTGVEEKAAPLLSSTPRHYRIALGGGALFLSPDVWGPSVTLHAARHFDQFAVYLAADVEPTSNFHLENRPFRTVQFGGRAGGHVSFWRRRLIGFDFGIGVVTRISRYKRDRYGSKWQMWADIGAGAHLSLRIAPWESVGFLLTVGIDLYPAARNIVIEDGPKKRVGFVAVPANAGVYVKF